MNAIFVFGSNRAGRHGKGAALYALMHHGAVYWQGEGRQGNSYAIPTKDSQLQTLPLVAIKRHVDTFISYARANPTLAFQMTPIGCGLAGYTRADIEPMLADAPPNVLMPPEWRD